MIYVSQEQLDQVEYLIGQSLQGNHILFDQETVRRVFEKNQFKHFNDQEGYSVEHHIERIILQPSLAEKRAYLEKLDTETFDRVVRTYFNIVENNLFDHEGVKH